MTVLVILGISIILQGITTFLTLFFFPITGRARVWVLLSAATVLMTAQPCFAFTGIPGQPESIIQARFIGPLFPLFISILMPAMILSIGTIFKNLRKKDGTFQENEVGFRTLFESLPIGISITDKDGNIVEANQI